MKNFNNCALLIVLYLVILVDSIISGILTTGNVEAEVKAKQCMEEGGHCKTSSDCCSNECITYSNKCVKGSPSSGTSGGYTPPNKPIEHATSTSVKGVDCDDYDESETFTIVEIVKSKLYPSSGTIYNSSQCFALGQTCNDSSQCCSNACLDYLNWNVCTIAGLPESSGSLCRMDGGRCFGHDECCSKRCIGFPPRCKS